MPLVYLNKQQSYDITSKACTLVTFSTWLQKKNNGFEKHSKLETIEISDESTNPRCRSQVWQHFGFKVTYNDNGLSFKSSTEVICQTSFNRKQES